MGHQAEYKKGDVIGNKYEVYGVLGKGGCGIVYLVYHAESGNIYALKSFLDKYLKNVAIRDRFRKEASIWIHLGQHPNIVSVYYVDELSGRLFIASEYISGDSNNINNLEDYFKKQPPDLEQSLVWAIQFCHGIEYAYSKGIKAHRDIKPANILINSEKYLKISDFGLSGIMGLEKITLSEAQSNDTQTVMGTGMGTPTHMSPEQFLNSASCDQRSDIYSFGVVLFQLVNQGKLPFSTDNLSQYWQVMQYLHKTSPVPPFNSPLLPIVKKCLEKMPENRYGYFREIRSDIEAIYRRLYNKHVVVPMPGKNTASDWNNKGASLDKLGKTREALVCYEEALKIEPEYCNPWVNKGIAHARLNELSQAMMCYDKALEIDSENVLALSNKALALELSGRLIDAINYYTRSLGLMPTNHLAWINLSSCQFSAKKYHDALVSADKAIEISPDYASAWSNKGLILYNFDREQEAFVCFNKAIQLDPFGIPAYENVAMMMFDKGMYGQAVACYDQIISIKPDHEKAWIRKGDCLLGLHNFNEAVKCYGTVAHNNENSLDAWIGGSIAYFFLHEDKSAGSCHYKAKLLDPGEVYTMTREGELFLYCGCFDRALEMFDNAIKKNPRFPTAWLGRHNALKNLSRVVESEDALNKYKGLS